MEVTVVTDLLHEVEPAVVHVVLGEGGHRLRPLPQGQVAVAGLADHAVVQLLRRGVVVVHLEGERERGREGGREGGGERERERERERGWGFQSFFVTAGFELRVNFQSTV